MAKLAGAYLQLLVVKASKKETNQNGTIFTGKEP
jgi:hypothetical protein